MTQPAIAPVRVDVQNPKLAEPPPAPTTSLDPLSGAGVKLTQNVLSILACVLLMLFIPLTYQEYKFSKLMGDAYGAAVQHLPLSGAGASPVWASLQAGLQAAEQSGTGEALGALKPVGEKLRQLQGNAPAADQAKIDQLAADVLALAAGASGKPAQQKAHELLLRLEALPGVAAALPETVEHMKARQELLKAYLDAASQTRDFWKGMAQMILLNLLLPVLTGLLGYVFASRAGKP